MKTFVAGIFAAASMLAVTPAMAETFEGPYIGVQAGWNQNRVRSDASIDPTDVYVRDNKDSFNGGAYAGYDVKVTPSVVIGAEAGFNIGVDDAVRTGADVINPNYGFDLSARAGYLVTPRTMAYVRGGYDNVRARVANAFDETHETFDGWSVGGGFEHAVTDNVSARIEYRYSDLGSNGADFDRHQALVGLGYHF